jgi:hypothetical protein
MTTPKAVEAGMPEGIAPIQYVHPRRPENGKYGHFGLHRQEDGTGDCGGITSCESEGCTPVEVVESGTLSKMERMEAALREIRGSHCINTMMGLGYCYKNGGKEDAKYGAERVCDACRADRALTESEKGMKND